MRPMRNMYGGFALLAAGAIALTLGMSSANAAATVNSDSYTFAIADSGGPVDYIGKSLETALVRPVDNPTGCITATPACLDATAAADPSQNMTAPTTSLPDALALTTYDLDAIAARADTAGPPLILGATDNMDKALTTIASDFRLDDFGKVISDDVSTVALDTGALGGGTGEGFVFGKTILRTELVVGGISQGNGIDLALVDGNGRISLINAATPITS